MKRTKLGAGTKSMERGSSFEQRRSALTRAATKKKRAAKRERTGLMGTPYVDPVTRKRVMRRSGYRCIVCGQSPYLQIHHVLPKGDGMWPELANEQDNLVGVCVPCHARHENAHRRIRWHELPECAVVLAYATSGAAAVYLERTYPVDPTWKDAA